MANKIVLEPFTRVEGDLKVELTVEEGMVKEARASGVMFRGFEFILRGHHPEDALVYTPRICGICSISHSVASSEALRAVSEDIQIPINGMLAKNIAHATENVMSHITQFYLYFLPDLIGPWTESLEFYPLVKERFAPLQGTSQMAVVRQRKNFLDILGYIAGKWPHTLAIHPGGITKTLEPSDIYHINGILVTFKRFIEHRLLGMTLEEYLQAETEQDLKKAILNDMGNPSDLALFYRIAEALDLMQMGRSVGRFISGGVYPLPEGGHLFRSGYYDGQLEEFSHEQLKESITFSFFSDSADTLHPFEEHSEPVPQKKDAYSWAKAPRYKGRTVETGALARQVISGDPLITDLFQRYGSTVFTRVFARLHEALKLLYKMKQWVDEIVPSETFYTNNTLKTNGKGAGITEAARGLLGHWIVVEDSRILNYQVITPTAINFSPRDEKGIPGPVEQALQGTAVGPQDRPWRINLIIRSFDPCLVCTVH